MGQTLGGFRGSFSWNCRIVSEVFSTLTLYFKLFPKEKQIIFKNRVEAGQEPGLSSFSSVRNKGMHG